MWWVRHIRFAQLHCPLDGAIDKRNGQRKHLKRSENRVPGRFSVRKEKKLWQDGHWKTAHRSQKPCYVFQSMPYRGASAFSFAFNNQSSPFSLSGLISGVVSPNCASKQKPNREVVFPVVQMNICIAAQWSRPEAINYGMGGARRRSYASFHSAEADPED